MTKLYLVEDPKLVENAIQGAMNALIANEPQITHYDTILGDGDCGITLKTAALCKRILIGYYISCHVHVFVFLRGLSYFRSTSVI